MQKITSVTLVVFMLVILNAPSAFSLEVSEEVRDEVYKSFFGMPTGQPGYRFQNYVIVKTEIDYENDGDIDSVELNSYNDDGLLTKSEWSGEDNSVHIYSYNEKGYMVGLDTEDFDNPSNNIVHTFSYANDRVRVIHSFEMPSYPIYSGMANVWRWAYDENGNNLGVRYIVAMIDSERNIVSEYGGDFYYFFYDGSGRIIREEIDRSEDGVIDESRVYTFDNRGVRIRDEYYREDETNPYFVIIRTRDFDNLTSTEQFDDDVDGDIDYIYYYTWEYLERSELGEPSNGSDDDIVTVTGMTCDTAGNIQANTPVTFTMSSIAESGGSVYYKFFYRANYGSTDYDSSPWVVAQDYSTRSSCDVTFPSDGNYIVVVRTVTDPNDEPSDLPIIGGVVPVGSGDHIVLSGLSSDAIGDVSLGDTVTYTVNGTSTDGAAIYYKWFYRANYGTYNYDSSPWVVAQNYSLSNSCDFNFPNTGKYIVVVRAVTDPNYEPPDLPIIGGVVSVK